jgi:hypothetical protein
VVFSARWVATRALAAALLAGCAAASEPAQDLIPLRELEPLETGEAQFERLCGSGNRDVVIDLFCAGQRPQIGSFLELREGLGLGRRHDDSYQGFAVSGHSTSLVSRVVSAINPRAIFVQPESHTHELMALAFARGEQFSEIVTRDRSSGELTFYLVAFTQDCNESDRGCTPGDLLTPAVERDWRSVDVYSDADLVNTPFDCLVCHQPDGPGTRKFLRMQELQPPWNHWFYKLSQGGQALIADYLAAKGDEPFAGLSERDMTLDSEPGLLSSTLFFAGSRVQPNEYVSARIEPEVRASAAAHGVEQPWDNSVPGESETWHALYERANRGDAIAVPYHDVKVSDPAKLALLTQAYTDYREGRLSRDELPDLRDVRPDDPTLLARMGLGADPALDGEALLRHACGQCHNGRLDQNVSRARFNVDLEDLPRAAKQRAIARIELPVDDSRVMPPALFRHLDEGARRKLVELLER